MEGYQQSSYGDRIADIYDELYGGVFDVEATVSLLAELAREGPVLELAIGTGRVALPLAERGVEVHGVDISEAMVAKLRAKPGGADIPVTMGDFADVPVDQRYRVVFIVFNTLFGLPSQEEQVRCLRNVARALTEDGVFLIEAFVPDVSRFDAHQTVRVEDVTLDGAMLEVSRHNPVLQTVASQHVILSSGRSRCIRSASVTRTLRSSTSWPCLPGSNCETGGAAGAGSRSPRAALPTCRCTQGWAPLRRNEGLAAAEVFRGPQLLALFGGKGCDGQAGKGSAHHQPSKALATRPTRRKAER